MEFTYDFYANRWRICSISYYFRMHFGVIEHIRAPALTTADHRPPSWNRITDSTHAPSVGNVIGFTYDFYAIRWRMRSISYYFRNSSASINNVTNVNYDIYLQKMYMYSCKVPQMLCLTR